MDEEKVLKKLEEIKKKRLELKEAALKAGDKLKPEVSNEGEKNFSGAARRTGRALTEEEIEKRMKEWRESPDATCKECGACSFDEDADKGD